MHFILALTWLKYVDAIKKFLNTLTVTTFFDPAAGKACTFLNVKKKKPTVMKLNLNKFFPENELKIKAENALEKNLNRQSKRIKHKYTFVVS